jgi:tetratricopeptide (TPR) repeat protein
MMQRPTIRLATSAAAVAMFVLSLPIRADDASERRSTLDCMLLSASAPGPSSAQLIATYERCRGLDTHDAVLRYDLGALYEAVGDPRAEAAYRDALAIDPAYADAHVKLGWLRFRAGDRTAARAEAERALALTVNGAAATALWQAVR